MTMPDPASLETLAINVDMFTHQIKHSYVCFVVMIYTRGGKCTFLKMKDSNMKLKKANQYIYKPSGGHQGP